MRELFDNLKERFDIGPIRNPKRGQYFLDVSRGDAPLLITWLKDYHGFGHLAFMTAVDYEERGVFSIVYMLHNHETHTDIGIHVEVPRNAPVMDSIHHLWAQASTFQRELKEMFGIDFPKSPRIDEGLLLEGWDDIPPMRRDFDTKAYAEKTYFPGPKRQTYDPEEYMKSKLYPEKGEDDA